MAREKKTADNKSGANFKEFEFKGKEFTYTGRVYVENKKSFDKVDSTPMNLTLNGVITIKGCKLMQSDNATWISFPQYKDKNNKYVSYFYIDKAFDDEEFYKVALEVEKLIK